MKIVYLKLSSLALTKDGRVKYDFSNASAQSIGNDMIKCNKLMFYSYTNYVFFYNLPLK